MNFLMTLVLASVLALGGCAGVPGSRTADPAITPDGRTAAPPATTQASRPTGAMSPVQAGLAGSRGGVAPLSAPVDLWDRIRRGYAMPDLESDLVRDREQWYASRPDYILRMTERSRKYLFHIVEELERRNMPTELALLPFIESAFNPQAVSSAKAAGMWQFMPATGKYFELKQNVFRDDRRDVLASTRAALDYLQKLYGMFGDWHLALAAYNWGEGSVSRAIAKNQRAGLGTSYPELSMPMETRFYVPKLQAVKNIVARPSQFNAQLPQIDNHPYFETVTISRDIDVALAAKLAEVPLDDFKALNPSLNRPVILAAGTPQILLPWDNATLFQRNLQAYTGARLASWTAWVAPSTMKLSEVAKRTGMSEPELRQLNNIPPRMLIRAGSTLLVTRPAHIENNVAEAIADNAQVALAPEVTLNRTTVKTGKHDTVASIAKRYRQTPANVAEWNKVAASASFKPGQNVVLFLPASVKTAKTSTGRAATKTASRTSNSKKSQTTRVARR